MKDKIEKKINSIINTNDLTDMQVWGIWYGRGVSFNVTFGN